MSNLLESLEMENTRTSNGMVTNSSSLNECVNLFFSIGAMRGSKKDKVLNLKLNLEKLFITGFTISMETEILCIKNQRNLFRSLSMVL